MAPIAYYLQKMISAETWHKTHNGKLLAIIKAFKSWQNYLNDCKHKVFRLINHKKLCYFIDIKNPSFYKVW